MGQPPCPSCGLALPSGARVCPHDGTVLEALANDPTQLRDRLIGSTVGEYVVGERVGVGGMGIVYKATQPVIGKKVAIKVLRPDLADPDRVKRLLDEARTVSAIGHRGIADVFSFGTLPDGRQYFVMEYLKGTTLLQVLQQRAPLPVWEMMSIVDQLLEVLIEVHAAGVVHRDLKPGNVFLVESSRVSDAWHVKIFDFGLARAIPLGERTGLTQVGLVEGTPEYMAPEQALGLRVTAAADLYAIGVIAFELVTGKLPFTAPTRAEIMVRHVEHAPPRPSDLVASVPPAVDAWIAKLLEKNPTHRPASAREAREALARARAAPAVIDGGAASTVRQRPVPARRRLAPVVLAVLLPVASVAGAVAWLRVPRGELPPPPPPPPVVAAAPIAAAPVVSAPEVVEEPLIEAPSRAGAERRRPPPAAVAPGHVHLTLKGWANVSLDGRALGQVPSAAIENNTLSMPAGKHRLTLAYPNGTIEERPVTVRPGETIEVAAGAR